VSDPRLLLAVDGGNSKTDLALVREGGGLAAFERGPMSSPHHIGLHGCLDILEQLYEAAGRDAGLDPDSRPLAHAGQVLLAGADLPEEERELAEAMREHSFANELEVGNDAFAVLRAGTERGWGVAVVCGAGMNCVGVAPDGRHARFPALGPISGDWGGGYDLGLAGLSAAARAADGRGPSTALEHAVPAHLGLATPREVAVAIHRGGMSSRRLVELAPVVLAEAETDPVAAAIVDRLVDETVAFAGAALRQLDLTTEEVDVVLGGGVLRFGPGQLVDAVTEGILDLAPRANVSVVSSPPVVGAALLALDGIGADDAAKARARDELDAAAAAAGDGRLVIEAPDMVGPSDG
jgi:N-acetylglucosamine kinase-like BadF-type ATPase